MSDFDLWEFKHEPVKFDDMILNKNIKPKLRKAIKTLPNMMLYGKAGVGKSTYAHVLLKATGIDYMWINASDETGIDVMRDKVKSFAGALGGKNLKMVIFNEADSLSLGQQGAQKMLKQLMENVKDLTRFMFLTNHIHTMLPELLSRCRGHVIEITDPPAKEIFSFCEKILKSERVKYNKKTVIDVIKKCYPDIRSTIEVLQANTFDNVLKGSNVTLSEDLFHDILTCIIQGDIEEMRKILKSHVIDYIGLYDYLFENIDKFKSPGDAILEIGDHLYRDISYPIKEINFIHMVFAMMKKGIV